MTDATYQSNTTNAATANTVIAVIAEVRKSITILLTAIADALPKPQKIDPEAVLKATLRKEAARRSADNLLR